MSNYIRLVTITEEQQEYLKQNKIKPSHVMQGAIDMMRGKVNPLYNVVVAAVAEEVTRNIVKKLKEEGVLK